MYARIIGKIKKKISKELTCVPHNLWDWTDKKSPWNGIHMDGPVSIKLWRWHAYIFFYNLLIEDQTKHKRLRETNSGPHQQIEKKMYQELYAGLYRHILTVTHLIN